MANKFIRGMIYNSGSTTARVSYLLKFMYEFCGFAVNGGASLIAPGGVAGSTTIAVGSNGATLPQATINVVSTTGFPTSGTAYIVSSTGTHLVTYTGTTGTTLTGASGGGGTLATGGTVNSTAFTGGALPGNFNGVGTTIAAGSNGAALPQATINVVTTAGFPTTGNIFVFTSTGTQTVAYTGTTGTTFTGCTGGLGTMSTGGNVTSSSLMTIGADGYTNATTVFKYDGYTDFFATSAPFTSNMIGKQLTMWKAGSNSSEDSVYNIISFKNPSNIVININSGGTPAAPSDGYKPTVTTRTSINYRVVDTAAAATATGIADGNFVVFQLDPTGVNAGQANSQMQFLIANTNLRLDFKMSPNGSWTGSAFGADASATLTPNVGSSSSFFNGATSGQTMHFNMVGDKSFLIAQSRDSGNSHGSGYFMHYEIPDRLYTAAQDPNPLAASINGYNATLGQQFHSNSTTYGYGGGFVMRDNAGTFRNHRISVKALSGDGNANLSLNLANSPGNGLVEFRAGANPITGSLFNSAGVLTLPGVAGQFSLARSRLRNVRFANTFMTQGTRFSSQGDFILLTMGVAIAWDKTVLPYSLFQF